MAYINLASLRLCTESEGPGKRMAIWVQGCNRRCLGCCNPEMQIIKQNVVVDTKDIIELIKKVKEIYKIEGISLIGGEPILQARGLFEVAKAAKSEKLTVLVFTGYQYEELVTMKDKSVKQLLEYIDILVDGSFQLDLYDEKRDWVGSSNQNVLFLTNAYSPGVEYAKHEHQMEVLVSENDILINGWPYV